MENIYLVCDEPELEELGFKDARDRKLLMSRIKQLARTHVIDLFVS